MTQHAPSVSDTQKNHKASNTDIKPSDALLHKFFDRSAEVTARELIALPQI